jgi:hypothetical protein
MTILEALEEVNESLRTPMEFVYAGLNEANFNLDSVTNSNHPVIIVLPFTPVDNPGRSSVLKTTVELQFFILNKITGQKTTDFTASEVETQVIAPMRDKARAFIFKLNQHSIIDPETQGITNVRYQPSYSQFDSHLYGVFVTANVPVMEVITGCEA